MTPTPWDALLLRKSRAEPFQREQAAAANDGTSKAGQIRLLLRSGPMSAAAICMDVDIKSTGLVSAVLKHDLAMGRIRCANGMYELCDEFEQDLQRRIKAAKALLVDQGYRVEKA